MAVEPTDVEPLYCANGGIMTYIDDEYGWDGDYEVYRCTCAKGRHYIELPG